MKLTEAAKTLGIHYVSVHRLRRTGKLKRAPDGVEAASVLAYLRTHSKPAGYIAAPEAAKRLGIPSRHAGHLAAAKLVTARVRPGRGWWVLESDVEELERHPDRLAVLGLKIRPPRGWLSAAEASKRLNCSRSWLSRLGRKGLIRRREYGLYNHWYSAEDVRKYLAACPTPGGSGTCSQLQVVVQRLGCAKVRIATSF